MTDDAGPQRPQDAVEVGTVVAAWGVKGWLKVKPHATDPQALLASREWCLEPPAGPLSLPLPPRLTIIAAREHADGIVAQAREVADRGAAEALKGARVLVSRSSFPPAGPEEFYWVDLIGLEVVNRQGDALGTVVDLIDSGVHCVLRVAPAVGAAAADERLIPFVSAYVDSVSLAERRIVADWGLDY